MPRVTMPRVTPPVGKGGEEEERTKGRKGGGKGIKGARELLLL